jgi:hypothetical protein
MNFLLAAICRQSSSPGSTAVCSPPQPEELEPRPKKTGGNGAILIGDKGQDYYRRLEISRNIVIML